MLYIYYLLIKGEKLLRQTNILPLSVYFLYFYYIFNTYYTIRFHLARTSQPVRYSPRNFPSMEY